MLNDAQRREKEEAVYHAVLDLLAGGADVTALRVQQIADAAGIGKGTVYEYFASKQEILRGATVYCLDSELKTLEDALAPCATLEAAVDALTDYLRGLTQSRIAVYQMVARAMVQIKNAGPCGDPETAGSVLRRLRDMMAALFGRLHMAGELDPQLDEEYFVHTATAACFACTIALSPGLDAPPVRDPAPVLQRTRLLLCKALR